MRQLVLTDETLKYGSRITRRAITPNFPQVNKSTSESFKKRLQSTPEVKALAMQNMAARPEERSLPETLLTYFLQVLGAVTAIIFGVFGILSWSDGDIAKRQAETALQQADTANFLALVALCAQASQGGSVSIT